MLKLMRAVVFSFRLLMHERGRLIASVGGVTFALLLMLLHVLLLVLLPVRLPYGLCGRLQAALPTAL